MMPLRNIIFVSWLLCVRSQSKFEGNRQLSSSKETYSVTLAENGESCTDACGREGKICTKNSLKSGINSTNAENIESTVIQLGFKCWENLANESIWKPTPQIQVSPNNPTRGKCYPRSEGGGEGSFDCGSVSSMKNARRICHCENDPVEDERPIYVPDGSHLSIVLAKTNENCNVTCNDEGLMCNWKSLTDVVDYTTINTIEDTVTQLGMRCWKNLANVTTWKATPQIRVSRNNTNVGRCYPRDMISNKWTFDCNHVPKMERSKRICGCIKRPQNGRNIYNPDCPERSIVLGFVGENCRDACSGIGQTCSKESLIYAAKYTKESNIKETIDHLGMTCASLQKQTIWKATPQIQQKPNNPLEGNCFPREETDKKWAFDCLKVSKMNRTRRICGCSE